MFRIMAALSLVAVLLIPGKSTTVAQETRTAPRPRTTQAQTKKAGPQTPTRVDRSFRTTAGRKPQISKPTVVLKPGEAPNIQFETPIYNFGRVRSGTEILYDFWYTNTGTGPLEILRVKPGCGCTTAGEYDRIVQPGERGKISIKLNTRRFSGSLDKPVTVNTNAAGPAASVTLHLQGEAWRAFEVAPAKASFGRVSSEAVETRPPVRKLSIVNNLESPLHPSDIRVSNPAFSAALKVIEEGKRYELEITLKPPLHSANNSATIEIGTGIENEPSIRIQASAYVTAPVDVMPSRITLPQQRDRDWRRTFIIRNNAAYPIQVSDLRISTGEITGTLSETKPGQEFRVGLVVPKAYRIPPWGDTITLKTSHPKLSTLTIPIVDRKNTAAGTRPVADRKTSVSGSGVSRNQPAGVPRSARRAKKPVSSTGSADAPARPAGTVADGKKKSTAPVKEQR